MGVSAALAAGLIGLVLGGVGSFVSQIFQSRLVRMQKVDEVRREIYSDYMHEVNLMQKQFAATNAERAGAPATDADRKKNKATISTIGALKKLEEIRMNSEPLTERGATLLWTVLKESPEWMGGDLETFPKWEGRYWQSRRDFINLVRTEFGSAPINFHDESRYVGGQSPDGLSDPEPRASGWRKLLRRLSRSI